jgi:hypothetical protein
MAFRFDWEALVSSPGVAATVQERLQSIIDEVADTRPPFLGPIEVTDVGFGAVAPHVELLEISELELEGGVAAPRDGTSAPLLSPLRAKIFLQWDSDVTVGIATELKAPFGMVGLLLEGTLVGIDFEGVFVLQVCPSRRGSARRGSALLPHAQVSSCSPSSACSTPSLGATAGRPSGRDCAVLLRAKRTGR